jgi:predicted CXXCH cytochrome family protein
MNGTPGKQCAKRPATARPWIAAMLCAAAVIVCAHCTPEQRYQTLSFFFDGVPEPEVPTTIPDEQTGGPESVGDSPKPVVVVYTHEPYKKGKCDGCHDMIEVRSSATPRVKAMCSKCHTGFNEQSTFWHGPVAAWACLQCHSAHESPNKALLKKPPEKLCATCHDLTAPTFIESNDAHASKEDCTRCHDPHGSENRLLLKS